MITVLAVIGLVLVLSPPANALCRRLGIPGSAGYIILGLILGTVLRATAEYDNELDAGLAVLAQLGIVALLFRVGLRSHTSALLEKLPSASLIWVGNVALSAASGYLVAHFVLDASFTTSLIVATAFSATSIAISAAAWDEAGQLTSSNGQLLLDVAELDDLSAAIFLAVLVGVLLALDNGHTDITTAAAQTSIELFAKLTAFIVGCFVFARFIEPRFTRFNMRFDGSGAMITLSILGMGLLIAAIGGFLGFSLAIGALFAGLAFSRDPESVREEGRFQYFYDFLTPFFFVYIGLQTDLTLVLSELALGCMLLAAAVLSKVIGTYLPALLSVSREDALTLGLSMMPRAEIALVVLVEARAVNDAYVPDELFAAMIFVSLATCILTPILVRRRLTN